MSFLRDYLTYASKNEAPVLFHVWGAYVALSSAIARKCWLPFGAAAIYPNIYVLLVGDAGNGKSRAMYNCKKLLKNVKPEIPMSGSLETPPGLWRAMSGDSQAKPPIPGVGQLVRWPHGIVQITHPMTITANEFINFISMDDKGWINALNDIFDEDAYIYRTKNMGTDKLIGPYIVMYGGLTTDMANDMQKQKIISTGLARRTIFQYGQRRFDDPHAILQETPEMAAAFDRCLVHLNQLRTVAGEFTWNEETQAWWTTWYNKHNLEVMRKAPQVRSWYASKTDQVLKIAMLSCLGEGFDLKLGIPHLKTAVELLEMMEKDLYRIFGGVGRNELAGVATQMFEFISGLPEPISKKQLKLRLFSLFNAKNIHQEFEEALSYLVGEKRVRCHSLTVGTFIDIIVATPQVLEAWGQKNGVVVQPAPVDVIQRELDRVAEPLVDPLPQQAAPPNDGPVEEPPVAAPHLYETATLPPPKPAVP